MAGGPSMMMLIHKIWIAVNGAGRPMKVALADGEHGADVCGKLEAHELDDVLEDGPAFAHRPHDGGEVVVGEHHRRRLPGHFRAGNAHGHADVGGLERGRVVNPVAGHGHDMTAFLQRRHDLDLVLGRHAGEHGDPFDGFGKRMGAHRIQFRAAHHLAVQPQLVGDSGRGDPVVAGDHLDLDAGAVAQGDGRLRLGSRRVLDANETLKGKAVHPRHEFAAGVEVARRDGL